MLQQLIVNHYEAAAVLLSGIGLTNLLLQRNLIKKIIGLNIMDTAVYLFLAAKGYIAGQAAPILIKNAAGEWITSNAAYVNPVPAGLVLTGIVVSVSMTAFALALTLRLYEHYGTLNIDEVLVFMARKQEAEELAEENDDELLFDSDSETTLTGRDIIEKALLEELGKREERP
ncbi:MAG: cation:proton antiporter subunit C [Synergistaceae bacterium]|nr:cation:proton antiporter subunit C [Synergistaceae bacterium]